jgi:hypothetical protein
MLGLVTVPSQRPLALKTYDEVPRLKAQTVVTTSLGCGKVYVLMSEETGEDREKIVNDLRQRSQ